MKLFLSQWGLDDSGVLCGLAVGPETVQRYLNEIKVATYPQLMPKILLEKRSGTSLLVFEISEYPVKPVAYKNRYYKRAHNSNHLLMLEEIVALQQQSLLISFDACFAQVATADLDVNLSYSFDGSLERKERWQYPLEALRELLLNAVVHRL